MHQELLRAQVLQLRQQGKTIRAIATALGVHRSRIHRALQALSRDGLPTTTPTAAPRHTLEESFGRVFVGRQHEMAVLMNALEDALNGQGRVVVLRGEAGIGKTRMAQELVARAQQRRIRVLWGRCYEGEGAPIYWPWRQIVRSYIEPQDCQYVHAVMGQTAASIAEVVPELRVKLPDTPVLPRLEPAQARFRLFDALTMFVKRASQAHPLLLLFDNLHWADRSSLLLFEFLTQAIGSSPLLVVGTYREVSRAHPLAHTLGELTKAPYFQCFELHGFTQDDVAILIASIAGFVASRAIVDAVYQQTEGNPLFVTETVRLLVQEGQLSHEATGHSLPLKVPTGVRDAIGRRLHRLSLDGQEVLTTAAVMGREFRLAPLRQLASSLSEDRLLELLEEALAARIIEEMFDTAGYYQFTHALIQATLSNDLSVTRRAQLHGKIGEALESVYGDDLESHAPELAYHFAAAVTIIGPAKMIQYTAMAGKRALAAYAWEDALVHYQQALTAAEYSLSTDSDVAALLLGLGQAQRAAFERHQIQHAVDTLRQAVERYVKAQDVAGIMAVVAALPYPVEGLTQTSELLRLALLAVPAQSLHAGQLWHLYGNAMGIEEGNEHAAQDAFSQAMAMAKRTDDVTLELQTLASAASVDRRYFHVEVSLDKSLQAIALASRVCDLQAEVKARQYASLALAALGDLDKARAQAMAKLAGAQKLRTRYWMAMALAVCTLVSRLDGDWQAARTFSEQGLDLSPNEPNLLGQRAMLEYEVGDVGTGGLYIERLLAVMHATAPGSSFEYAVPAIVLPLLARIAGDHNLLREAAHAAAVVLSSPATTLQRAVMARIGQGLIAVQRSDIEAAQVLYDTLATIPQTMFLTGFASHMYVLALLAQTAGQLDQAVAHSTDAIAFLRRAGYTPELAWASYDYAAILLQRLNASNAPHTSDVLDEALSVATKLGMPPLMERIVTLQEQSKTQAASPRGLTYPEGLTPREIEVLHRLALGKSNQVIAAELFISPHTVVHHVTHILSKTGTENRTEAASYAIRQGLVG